MEKIKKISPVLICKSKNEKNSIQINEEVFEILIKFSKSSEYAAILESKIIARELGFNYLHKQNEKDYVMRGIIDLLLEKNGKIYIIDYKSDFVTPNQEHIRSLEYKSQCEIYKNFVSKLFPNLQICSKVLFLRTAKSVEV